MRPTIFLRAAGITAALHLYLALRLLPALPIGGVGISIGLLLLVVSMLLTPLPLLARAVWRREIPDRLATLGYFSMGVFSSLLVLTLLRDLLLLVVWALQALSPSWLAPAALASPSAIAVIVLTLAITLIGLYNALRLAKVVTVEVPIAGLPAALHGFSIVQLSDIHVGPTIKRGYLQAIVDAVNRLQPQLIALTGDLVDGSVARLQPHVAPLAQLSATHGVYAVTGNHEYYSSAPDWIIELRRLGLRVLLNEHALLQHGDARLLLAGVTDYSAHLYDPAQRSDAHAALRGAPADIALKVLLAHQPRSAAQAAEAGFDLQLSGHTHGGQFLPWNFFVPLQQPFTAGLHRLKNLWVYTSRGTGYWGPPLRFGAPSEITQLLLVKA